MANETWKCPKCGVENDVENNFCGECGSRKPEAEIGTNQKNRNSNSIASATVKQSERNTKKFAPVIEDDEDDKIPEDKVSNQFLAASFCVPIIGLILGIYCLAKGKPKSGIACLMAGAASFTLISIISNM